jgi:hypothetical protein
MPTDDLRDNTDRELWRETPDDYYSPSIHVTAGGGIGINVGGTVVVRPVREWHALAVGRADDGERITDDWLLSVGGEELTADGKRRGIAVGTEPGLVLCWRWGHPDKRGWSLEHWDSNGECGWLELAAEPQTRGDFRRLAAALGVALKPAAE